MAAIPENNDEDRIQCPVCPAGEHFLNPNDLRMENFSDGDWGGMYYRFTHGCDPSIFVSQSRFRGPYATIEELGEDIARDDLLSLPYGFTSTFISPRILAVRSVVWDLTRPICRFILTTPDGEMFEPYYSPAQLR